MGTHLQRRYGEAFTGGPVKNTLENTLTKDKALALKIKVTRQSQIAKNASWAHESHENINEMPKYGGQRPQVLLRTWRVLPYMPYAFISMPYLHARELHSAPPE